LYEKTKYSVLRKSQVILNAVCKFPHPQVLSILRKNKTLLNERPLEYSEAMAMGPAGRFRDLIMETKIDSSHVYKLITKRNWQNNELFSEWCYMNNFGPLSAEGIIFLCRTKGKEVALKFISNLNSYKLSTRDKEVLGTLLKSKEFAELFTQEFAKMKTFAKAHNIPLLRELVNSEKGLIEILKSDYFNVEFNRELQKLHPDLWFDRHVLHVVTSLPEDIKVPILYERLTTSKNLTLNCEIIKELKISPKGTEMLSDFLQETSKQNCDQYRLYISVLNYVPPTPYK